MAVLSGAPNAAVPTHLGHIVTPFDLSARGGVVVAVRIDGGGPYRLLVDTGSTHSVFTEELVRAVGARPVATALTTSSVGARVVPVVAIGELALGPVREALMPSVVADLPVPGEADGLLGQDVLADQRYTLDLVGRQIVWHTAMCDTQDHPDRTVPLRAVEGRFVVSAEVGARAMDLVVDTASETLVVFVHPARVAAVRGGAGGVALQTITGSRSVTRGTVKRLRLGHLLQRDVDVVVVPRDVGPGQPEGLLPLRGFARVTIDGPRRKLILEADGPG